MNIAEKFAALPCVPLLAGNAPKALLWGVPWPHAVFSDPVFRDLVRVCRGVAIGAATSVNSNQDRIRKAAEAFRDTGSIGRLQVSIVNYPWAGVSLSDAALAERDPMSAQLATAINLTRDACDSVGVPCLIAVLHDLEHWKRAVWNASDTNAALRAMDCTEEAMPPVDSSDWFSLNSMRLRAGGWEDIPCLPRCHTRPYCPALYCGDRLAECYDAWRACYPGWNYPGSACWALAWGAKREKLWYGVPGIWDFDRWAVYKFGYLVWSASSWRQFADTQDYRNLARLWLWHPHQQMGVSTDPDHGKTIWWHHLSALVAGITGTGRSELVL